MEINSHLCDTVSQVTPSSIPFFTRRDLLFLVFPGVDGLTELPRVEIIYAYANVGRDFIDQCVASGCKGIVLAGVGDGNATQAAIAGLRDAVKKGVAVVRSSRTNSGITDRNVELNDDELGTIASMELNPQKARVMLMLGLTKTNDPKKLQEYFYQY